MPTHSSQKTRLRKTNSFPKVLILVGVAILVAGIFIFKDRPSQPTNQNSITAEAQFDQYLEAKKPMFVFIHSNTCQSCIDMIAIVDQVYPEFTKSVGLVDVYVYDPQNKTFLRRMGINTIPTQVFIDASGHGKVAMGAMTPEGLLQQLQALAGGGK